jgi:DNA-binding NarL/FixJ family response regulator
MTPVRLALSNDFEVVLAGLAAMLAPHGDRVEVVELTTSRRMSKPVDVILYDTFGRLPVDDAKLPDIVAQQPDAKVVVYSWDSYPVDTALSNGAAGFIHKGLTAAELADAIVAIHEGATVESKDPGADTDAMPTWPGQDAGLSARESEMLSYVARGLTNQEIASRAFLSINTVKTYIRTAYRKIGAQSRAQAVGWALTHGFELG